MEEAKIVFEKLGPQKAFTSMAFITDLVPGIIMAMGFGQVLSLLVLLVQKKLHCWYKSTNTDAERLWEARAPCCASPRLRLSQLARVRRVYPH